ncbi:MAG: PHP domain-containing protein [Bacteroidetes bacterium]|jgi:hypothetical protein|nr:PHP domain-containing protein [Bacteroidota bacterium]
MNILKKLPDAEQLTHKLVDGPINHKVNAHIHTPYSFSAFDSIEQAVTLARDEDIKALGINDFYVTDGYREFAETCAKNGIFPLFNIEFIGLNKEDQANNIRLNDPNNPGRTYFSGKGLNYPFRASKKTTDKLEQIFDSSQLQVKEMVKKTNDYLQSVNARFTLSFYDLRHRYAENLVRERHIAKAIRLSAEEYYPSPEERLEFYSSLFGKDPEPVVSDFNTLENEIRGALLKAGGHAFVPEDDNAFLSFNEIRAMILDAGGIPTYPLLLDDKNGHFTDFERSKKELANKLLERGVFSIEFIPGRNSYEKLKEYTQYFYNMGFLVTYGTEHNTPSLTPLTVACRDAALDDELKQVSYNGTCVIAAHQYLQARNREGYINESGHGKTHERKTFEELGHAVINQYLKQLPIGYE